ncbi:hypothetical protein [Gemmobacter sp. 24YEA27]|uniref:hypothetical protein n=1 Tax=Gemmobacter sp. 24YEA27 TaxID=3040672 RepID=UPI0024B3A600|nr:hypothetical protein [Gemmobacter sp. 24YEA27]
MPRKYNFNESHGYVMQMAHIQLEIKLRAIFIVLAASCIAAGCAKKPDQIPAADIGPNPYGGQSCASLNKHLLTQKQNLENLSAAQQSAASGDAWGVFLLGLPVSSMSGNDKEAAISLTKGHIQKIESEKLAKKCAA